MLFLISNRGAEPVYKIQAEQTIIYENSIMSPSLKLVANDSTLITENVP